MDPNETAGPSSGNSKDKETVKVVVRCRPLFGKELVEGRKSIVTLDQAAALISLKCPDNGQIKSFTFDSVYDENTSQRQFYDESGYPLVESIFDGYNGTIFAYGQTGCGKTHTMQGKDSPPELRGVIPLSFDHIFDTINADTTREYMVRASYLEIYNEDIRDLLNDDAKKKLDLKESADGTVYVKDLTEIVVRDVESMNSVMSRGFKNRTVGATLMNEGSSRSHSIFTVVVETSETIGGQDHFKAGKVRFTSDIICSSSLTWFCAHAVKFVDLAGSERQSKTGATGNRLKYKEEIERLRKMLESQTQSRGNELGTSSRMGTPSRPLSSSNSADLAKERQEIAKYQQEAAEMLERAKWMMDEAKALQAQNQPDPAKDSEIAVQKQKSSGVLGNLPPLLGLFGKQEARPEPVASTIDAQAKEMMAKAEAMMKEAAQRQIAQQVQVVVKEVIPDSHAKERDELRELNQAILNQRDRIGQELEQTQVTMEAYLREKEMLHAKLKKIESHILGGASGSSSTRGSVNGHDADSEVALLKQQVEYRRAQIKLREKAKKQAKNEAMRRALELEKQQVEEELKTAQEAAQASLAAARKKEAKYKAKLDATRQEIADLNSEFERERENLLDTIREQTKESKLLEQLVELFLPQNELVKVWERAVWSAGIESGGAEVVSEEDVNGRQGSAGATSHVTVRSLGSSSSTKRRKSSVSRQSSQNAAISPYEEGFTSQTPATTARLPSAIHTSRPDGKAALVSRGMSPHNSSNGSKERRKIKEKSSGTSGLPVSQYQRQPQDQEPQLASAYEAPGASHYFPGDDDLLTPLSGEYQPRDRLQSRQGSRQDSRQRSGSISGNSRAGLGQLEHTPPAATVEKTRSSSRGDSGSRQGNHRHRHKDRKERQEDEGAAGNEWVENGEAPATKRKSKHSKKKKERRDKAENGEVPADSVNDHYSSLRRPSFRSVSPIDTKSRKSNEN
ncbi:Kinesin-like protein [Phytophthora cactorum]|nr:Kinesin-like protein [Phytophthora cactorum]